MVRLHMFKWFRMTLTHLDMFAVTGNNRDTVKNSNSVTTEVGKQMRRKRKRKRKRGRLRLWDCLVS